MRFHLNWKLFLMGTVFYNNKKFVNGIAYPIQGRKKTGSTKSVHSVRSSGVKGLRLFEVG